MTDGADRDGGDRERRRRGPGDALEQTEFLGAGGLRLQRRVRRAGLRAHGGALPSTMRPRCGSAHSDPRTRRRRHGSSDIPIWTRRCCSSKACRRSRARCRATGAGRSIDLPKPLTLNGSFEGRAEAAQEITVLNFSADDRHYLIEPKQPRGQSGSPVCTSDGAVWAIAVLHYTDANTARGCVIAVHQFAEWLAGLLGGDVAFVGDPVGPAAEARQRDPGLSAVIDDVDATQSDHEASAAPPRKTEAALVSVGLADEACAVIVSACMVSDDPERLRLDLDGLRKRALNDALAPRRRARTRPQVPIWWRSSVKRRSGRGCSRDWRPRPSRPMCITRRASRRPRCRPRTDVGAG